MATATAQGVPSKIEGLLGKFEETKSALKAAIVAAHGDPADRIPTEEIGTVKFPGPKTNTKCPKWLAAETADMVGWLAGRGVDVYDAVYAELGAEELPEGNELAIVEVIYYIVKPIYDEHRQNEAIAVEGMKRKVAMALGEEKDLPGKQAIIDKLDGMLKAGVPVYSLLVESGAKKVLPAIAVLHAIHSEEVDELGI